MNLIPGWLNRQLDRLPKENLVLELFPGAGLLGMAFEQEGFCVVRGPDVLLGGDIRTWHAIKGKFNGIIGGPPCQSFSVACTGQEPSHGNLIPEFERIVREAQPDWYVMENVKEAPLPFTNATPQPAIVALKPGHCQASYHAHSAEPIVYSHLLEAYWFGAAQHRTRRFSSNLELNTLPFVLPEDQRHPDPWPTITATEQKYCGGTTDKRRAGRKVGRQMTLEEINVGMGLPADFSTPVLTKEMAYKVRGNGVPIPLGRAVARAVAAAVELKRRKVA